MAAASVRIQGEIIAVTNVSQTAITKQDTICVRGRGTNKDIDTTESYKFDSL